MLLVYGSLMSERVRTHVMGYSHPEYEPAWVTGYHRFALRDRSYPALCKTPDSAGEVLEGVLLKNLGPKALQVLDDFEGDEYVRTAIKVKTATGTGGEIDAFAYVWAGGATDPQVYGTWDYARDFLPKEQDTLNLWGFIKSD